MRRPRREHWRQPYVPGAAELRLLDLIVRLAADLMDPTHSEAISRDCEMRLKAADRRRNEIFATLAHELRNPLAALASASQHLRRAGQRPEVAELARDALQRQVAVMKRLLDDVVDISRMDHTMLSLSKQRVSVADVLHAAAETTHTIMTEHRHRLTVVVLDRQLRIQADPVRLIQILVNLLLNAAKYTDPGGRIELRAEAASCEVVITLRDNGIGIEPGMLRQIFEMFVQADSAAPCSEGGLGIGLALVRQLVELHGGTVSAESDGPGLGSTFRVRLPS